MHITFVSVQTRLTYNYRAGTNGKFQRYRQRKTHHIYSVVSENKKRNATKEITTRTTTTTKKRH